MLEMIFDSGFFLIPEILFSLFPKIRDKIQAFYYQQRCYPCRGADKPYPRLMVYMLTIEMLEAPLEGKNNYKDQYNSVIIKGQMHEQNHD